MKTTLRKLLKNEVELTIEVPPEEQKSYLEQAARHISRHTTIPGFRSGKAPYDLIEQKVGETAIYEEALEEIIKKTYFKALEQEQLTTCAPPKIEFRQTGGGQSLVYTATVALLPKVTLGNYRKFKARRATIAVENHEVEKVTQDLRRLRAKEVLENKKIAKGDKAEINFDISVDRVPIEGGSARKFDLIIGEGYFIPGFEDHLIGMTKGESKQFQLRFPKEYFQKNLANRPGDFTVTVQAVYRRELPQLDDAFAQSVGNGFQSMAVLKDQLKKNLEEEKRTKEQERFELAILDEIIAQSQFEEIPEVLIASEIEKMIEELKYEIETKRHLKFDDYLHGLQKNVDDLKKEFVTPALRRIKTALLVRAIAEAEAIDVPDTEVAAEIKKTLDLYRNNEEVKEKLATPEYFYSLKNLMINQKVFDLLNRAADQN